MIYNTILVLLYNSVPNFYRLLMLWKLATFPVLCNISLRLIYFIRNSLYLLIPYVFIALPHSLSILVNTSLFSISVSLFLFFTFVCFLSLNSIYKWYHTVCVFLCLTYFTKSDNTLQVHLCCCKWQNVILFMVEQYSILCVYILIHVY